MSWYKKCQVDEWSGIPEGYVEEGLNTEHPEIGALVNRYSYNNDATGILGALNHPDYEAYYADLQRLLQRAFGEQITVRRKEGYAGGTGQGVGEYVSVSTNPAWKGNVYVINRKDVVLAGYEAEGELIVKRTGLIEK